MYVRYESRSEISLSLTKSFAPLQITVIVSISVSVAMYCLIQLYAPVSSYLAPHRPLLKLFSVKAVGETTIASVVMQMNDTLSFPVFLTFWQATFLSLLATFGLVKDVSPRSDYGTPVSHNVPYRRSICK